MKKHVKKYIVFVSFERKPMEKHTPLNQKYSSIFKIRNKSRNFFFVMCMCVCIFVKTFLVIAFFIECWWVKDAVFRFFSKNGKTGNLSVQSMCISRSSGLCVTDIYRITLYTHISNFRPKPVALHSTTAVRSRWRPNYSFMV